MRVPVKFSRTPVGVKTSTNRKEDVLTGKDKRFYSNCSVFASGNRNNNNGELNNRAYNLNFNSSSVNPANNNRTNGFSVRCISELNNKYLYFLSMEELKFNLFIAYYLVRKNKRNAHNQLRFEINYEQELWKLYNDLTNRSYEIGKRIYERGQP